MALVVGLGNPGPEYAETRHNVGWRVVERLVVRWRASRDERRPEYRSWTAERAGRRVTLLEPHTFMNVSGEAVVAWGQRHGVDLADLLVVADDVYLPVGTLRLRASGSSGGHRGLESLEKALGSRAYARLRVGVGEAAGDAMREHVLGAPAEDEREPLERAVEQATEAVEVWLEGGIREAMNRFNRRVRKEVSEP